MTHVRRKYAFVGTFFLEYVVGAFTKSLSFAFSFFVKKHQRILFSQICVLYAFRDWGVGTSYVECNRETLRAYAGLTQYEEIVLPTMARFSRILSELLDNRSYTHLVLDTRVLVTNAFWWQIPLLVVEAWKIALICQRHGLIIVAEATDFHQRSDRIFLRAFGLHKGSVAISAAVEPSKRETRKFRAIGPCPVGIPWQTVNIKRASVNSSRNISVCFGGSLYSGRKQFFDALARELQTRNIDFKYYDKSDGQSLDEYFSLLGNSKIVVHTSVFSENTNRKQLNGKATEACSQGALLLAETCTSLDAFLTPFREYVPFDGLNDAICVADLVEFYLQNEKERLGIAGSGQRRMVYYEENFLWWPTVDKWLCQNSLRPFKEPPVGQFDLQG